jgi:hypothetical protein
MANESSTECLRTLENYIGAIDTWPKWLQDKARMDKLNLGDRFSFIVTTLGNVTPPLVVARHLVPRLANFDACRHAYDTFINIVTGRTQSMDYWDLA